jgi:hypothetical protein
MTNGRSKRSIPILPSGLAVTHPSWFRRLVPSSSVRRRRPMFAFGHYPAWIEILENRVLLSGQNVFAQPLTTAPGTPFEDVAVQFQFIQGEAAFVEVGVFQFDADGTVGGIAPGSEGFAEAVLNSSSRQVLFTQGTPTGSSASATFVGGRQIGAYFCQSTATGANQYGVQMTSANSLQIGYEQFPPLWPAVSTAAGLSARGFDDAVIQATFGAPVLFPVPTIDSVPEQTIPEEQPFELVISAQNPAGPQSDLRYKLENPPAGTTIDQMTGVFRWTPTELQGPGRYDIVVRVFNANRPDSFSTMRFIINVTEVNTAPVINPIPDQEATQLQQLSFRITATDADRPTLPTDRLTFSLIDSPAAGANINPSTGRFTWTPLLDDEPGEYVFTVRVVDNGNPALEDTATFTVILSPAM